MTEGTSVTLHFFKTRSRTFDAQSRFQMMSLRTT
jgi:hypothetical protein